MSIYPSSPPHQNFHGGIGHALQLKVQIPRPLLPPTSKLEIEMHDKMCNQDFDLVGREKPSGASMLAVAPAQVGSVGRHELRWLWLLGAHAHRMRHESEAGEGTGE